MCDTGQPFLIARQLDGSLLDGRGDEIRTHDTDFKDQCLRPLGDTPTYFLVPTLGFEPSPRALQAHASTRLA